MSGTSTLVGWHAGDGVVIAVHILHFDAHPAKTLASFLWADMLKIEQSQFWY